MIQPGQYQAEVWAGIWITHSLTLHRPERDDDAGAGQDCDPGGDRRGRRDDRLLPLQRLLRQGAPQVPGTLFNRHLKSRGQIWDMFWDNFTTK